MKIRMLSLALLLAAAPAFAADIDGNWSGSLDTPNGPVEIKFSFKADGDKLTGNSTGPDGSVVMFHDGKIMGAALSFIQDVDFGGQSISFNYTGMLANGQLSLHTEFNGMPLDFALKKTP